MGLTSGAPTTSSSTSRIKNLMARTDRVSSVVPFGTNVTSTGDTPAVTLTTTQSLTGRIVPFTDSTQVRVLGSRLPYDSVNGRQTATGAPGVDLYLTGTSYEIALFPAATGTLSFQIFVNGVPVQVIPDSGTSVTVGSIYYLKLVFPSAGRRRVEVFAAPISAWYWVGTDATTSVSLPPARPVGAWVGDSITGGSTPSPALQCFSFLASRMLGMEACVLGYAGSGYTIGGALNQTFANATRVAAVAACNPELIVIAGSVNDDPSSASAIQTAATACYAAYAIACPTAKIIVFGPHPSGATATLSAARQANNAAVRAAALSAPNVIAFHDQIGHAAVASTPAAASGGTTYQEGTLVTYVGSVWKATNGGASFVLAGSSLPGTSRYWTLQTWAYTGTGNVGGVVGDGTRDVLLEAALIHPQPDASAIFAEFVAASIRSDLFAVANSG